MTPHVPPTDRNPDQEPHAGHETKDVNIRGILWLAGGTSIGVVVVCLGLWMLYGYYQALAKSNDVPPSPLADASAVAPGPRLQMNSAMDYEVFRRDQEKQLTSYGWIDKQKGVARIPVSRAMDLLVERGLQTPTMPAAAEEKAEKKNEE